MTVKEILDWIVSNPSSIKLLISLIATIVLLPITIMWIRGGKIRKMEKIYTQHIVEMSEKVSELYKEIILIQAELVKAKGKLSIKEAELEILENRIAQLEQHISELMEKLKKNEYKK